MVWLQVLRADRETLLSVLETFVHDPLVDWTKDKAPHRGEDKDADNPHARDALATIAGANTTADQDLPGSRAAMDAGKLASLPA
jgi:phosphatidylinositol kinase/protein kinase (PI-3  family)